MFTRLSRRRGSRGYYCAHRIFNKTSSFKETKVNISDTRSNCLIIEYIDRTLYGIYLYLPYSSASIDQVYLHVDLPHLLLFLAVFCYQKNPVRHE